KRLCRPVLWGRLTQGPAMVEKLSVLVDGGKATPGPPLGPALGPLGLNIVEIIKAINEKTKSFEGMKVPVTLLVDPKSKAFTIEVGTPPTSAPEPSAAIGLGASPRAGSGRSPCRRPTAPGACPPRGPHRGRTNSG